MKYEIYYIYRITELATSTSYNVGVKLSFFPARFTVQIVDRPQRVNSSPFSSPQERSPYTMLALEYDKSPLIHKPPVKHERTRRMTPYSFFPPVLEGLQSYMIYCTSKETHK